MAANRLGVQRMQALCRKYGADIVLAVGDALQDYAERKMRAGIAALPDAAMPERPGRLDKGADPDVLPVVKGGIAMLVGPIQRRGRFEMRDGCTVVATQH